MPLTEEYLSVSGDEYLINATCGYTQMLILFSGTQPSWQNMFQLGKKVPG